MPTKLRVCCQFKIHSFQSLSSFLISYRHYKAGPKLYKQITNAELSPKGRNSISRQLFKNLRLTTIRVDSPNSIGVTSDEESCTFSIPTYNVNAIGLEIRKLDAQISVVSMQSLTLLQRNNH